VKEDSKGNYMHKLMKDAQRNEEKQRNIKKYAGKKDN
jgi:hypothetical protein